MRYGVLDPSGPHRVVFDNALDHITQVAGPSHLILVDGNKRAAWAALVMFIDLNDGSWDPDPLNIDEAEGAMQVIAGGDVDET